MCSPTPPAAPDYLGAAQAQGDANLKAATQTSQLNNPNVINPYGTQTYYAGNPNDAKGYEQSLIAELQAAQAAVPRWGENYASYAAPAGPNQSERTAENYRNLDRQASERVAKAQQALEAFRAGGGVVPQDVGRPTMVQTLSPEQQKLYDQQMQTNGLLGNLAIQGATSLGDVIGKNVDLSGVPKAPADYQTLRSQVIDAMLQRPTEDYARAVDQKQSDLIAAGIRPGSKAYDDQMQLLQRGMNDARTQAAVNAGTLTTQAFQTDSERRRQAIGELLTQRQVPLNEITALMSGSQVSNPFSIPGYAQNAQVQAAPVFAAANAAGNYATDVYNAKQAYNGQLMSGLFGLAGAGVSAGLPLMG
jgi:hypothetical protein